MRRILALSNCTSAREEELVSSRSWLTSGALKAAATTSPESPRRTETSPFNRLIRATPCAGSYSGSCAEACGGASCARIGVRQNMNRDAEDSKRRFMVRLPHRDVSRLVASVQDPYCSMDYN